MNSQNALKETPVVRVTLRTTPIGSTAMPVSTVTSSLRSTGDADARERADAAMSATMTKRHATLIAFL